MATASILCRDSWQCSTRFCSSSHRMARRAQDFKSCHRLSQENGSQRCACVCLNLLLKINNYWNWGHPSTLRIYIYIYYIYTVYIHISNTTPYITIQTYLRKVLVCWCDIDMFGSISVSACDSSHTELGTPARSEVARLRRLRASGDLRVGQWGLALIIIEIMGIQ